MAKNFKHKRGLSPSSFIQLPEIRFKGIKLSEKHILILELIALGFENKDIAQNLKISIRTVEAHIYTLRKILNKQTGSKLNDRELVLLAVDMIEGFTKYTQRKLSEIEKKQAKKKVEIIDDWDDIDLKTEFRSEQIISTNKIGNFCLV